jgi:nuclear GTP-binding protein
LFNYVFYQDTFSKASLYRPILIINIKVNSKNFFIDFQSKTIEEKRKRKQERKKLKANKKSSETSKKSSLDDLVKDAQRKQEMYDKTLSMLQENKNPFDIFLDENRKQNADKEQSLKSFYKEFKKVVEAADVIIEVLDARDPIGSRCLQVEEMIISSGTNKKLVLLLNKIDLVPKENTQAWLKYLRNQYPTVAFKSSTQNQNEKLVSHI